ncbi:MAG: tetratricopeptide repeat protein [Gammaproteobacteria bacterium]|nr:tetratricopeptide repeat protein [Gammaproteobacteria bacterium]
MNTPPALLKDMRAIGALLQAGQYDTARTRLEQILTRHPDYVEGLRLLAGTRLALGQSEAAETLLRHALELDPNWPPTLTTLAELLLASGRAAEAEPLLERAAGGSPADPRAAWVLARLYSDSGRAAEAVTLLAPFCAAPRLDAALAAQHSGALAALGRAEEAVEFYQARLQRTGADAGAAQALVIALGAAGRTAEAGRFAANLLGRGARSPELWLAQARACLANGEPSGAETALRECLQLDPRQLEAHHSLAQLLWVRSGDLRQATASLDAALGRFAEDDALWGAKAAILQGAGEAHAAYECLAPRTQRAQAAPSLLVRAGLAALDFDPGSALELAERALRLAPASAQARTLLAAAQLGVGKAAAALGHCEQLLEAAPDDQYLIALQTTALRLLEDQRYGALCDYGALVLPLMLEPPAPWGDLESFLGDLAAALARLHDPDGHALLFQSLRRGTETTQDLTRSREPAIAALFNAFRAPIERYLDHIGRGEDPLRRRNGAGWRFNGSWSVRLRDRGFHLSHVHPRGWISSACYIELPECMRRGRSEAGTLSFGVPGILTSPALTPEHTVRPEPGMLVLFPSYFWHGTVPFESPQSRLTVAFDAVPDRTRA